MEHLKRIQDYFKSHPDVEKFYVTHDGCAFFEKEPAEAYANSIFHAEEERTVVAVTRAEALGAAQLIPTVSESEALPAESEAAPPAKKVPAKKSTTNKK